MQLNFEHHENFCLPWNFLESTLYIFLNFLYGMMALAKCVFNAISFKVFEYPEITVPEQGLKNDSWNFSMPLLQLKPYARSKV